MSKLIKDFIVAFVLIFSFTGVLTSCKDFIDPAAANSYSAVIAVIGEYLFAIIVLILVIMLWVLRPAGIALAVLGILGLCDYIELSLDPILLICIGLLMFFTSFVPITPYEPLVVISKHFMLPKKEKVIEKHSAYHDLFIQLLVSFIMLIIEYSIFAK